MRERKCKLAVFSGLGPATIQTHICWILLVKAVTEPTKIQEKVCVIGNSEEYKSIQLMAREIPETKKCRFWQ